jgi:hypothetical protein
VSKFGEWLQTNSKLVGALGAGIGGILGLKSGSGDTQGSAGYQGGIPEYQYGRTLKDDAFANTYQQEVPVTQWYTTPGGMLGQRNVPGETTTTTMPRRPGGMGRSYFDYPETGSYSPVTTTHPDTGVVTQNILGGNYLDTLTASSAAAAAENEAFYQDLGQSYLDAYNAHLADSREGVGSREGTGVIDSGVITGGVTPIEGTPSLSGTLAYDSAVPTATGGLTSLAADPSTTAYVSTATLPDPSVSIAPGSTTTTTTGSASDLYNYLSGLGFGESAKTITPQDVESFTTQDVFSLDDIATALGTDATTLLGISSYVPPTALQTALSDMGFAAEGGKTITTDDIASLTNAGYTAADIATALGTDVSTLLSIANYVPPTALQTDLSGMGFAAEGGKDITADDISTLTTAGYALEDIAEALGVTESQLHAIAGYVAPTGLQTALSDLGFAVEGGKVITAADITSLTDVGYALDDIATVLGVTTDQLNSISGYTAPTALQTALSGMGFAAEGGRAITAGDISTLTTAGYGLADIASALGVEVADLNSISSYVAPTGLETALAALGFDATGGQTITADHITSLTDAGYTLVDIANTLGVTTDQLNSISSYVAPTGLETALSDLGFTAEGGQTITADHISSLTDDGYTLAEIATALNVTEAQLNSISSYVAPTGLETALVALGFDATGGQTITADHITSLTGDGYELADIAEALGVEIGDLTAISSYVAPTGLQTALADLGFDATGGQTITADHISTLTDAGYTLDDIAIALDVTTDELNSISSYVAPTGLETALSDLGFAVEGGKAITAGDISTLTTAGYALADIATALDVTTDQLNSISNYVAPTGLETALSDLGFAVEGGKTITAGDISTLTTAGYALADIAMALGVTEAQLNSISNYVAPTGLETALSDLGYAVEGGKDITAADITTLTTAGYALADIAAALGVTEAQLNSISDYTAPSAAATAVNTLLIDAGFGGDGRVITADDVAGWKSTVGNQSVYTLADIAAAFGMSEADLLAIDTSGEAAGGLLESDGYYLGGPTDGMADNVPATIDGAEPARLSDGEFVIPADVVSHLGNGNSEAGSDQLYSMMDRVRQERTGTTRQGAQINPMQQLPA